MTERTERDLPAYRDPSAEGHECMTKEAQK
jgi:hypothetical protein